MKLQYFALSVALACPAAGSAMGLLPQDKDKAAWESFQGQVLKGLGGSCEPVMQPPDRVTAAAMAGAARDELHVNKVVTVKLHAMDKVKQNRFAVAKPYQWVDFCGRRMKAGVFELRAGTRYWIQISAGPDPALDLFVAGPLN